MNQLTAIEHTSSQSESPIYLEHEGLLLAIIISGQYRGTGVQFFTPEDFSQQVAYMRHPSGKNIEAHTHNHVMRSVQHTQEVLIIRRGKLRVDFYTRDQIYVQSRVLGPGDVILLVDGGHGFQALEEIEMIEVKQGPYLGCDDKVRFPAVLNDLVKIVE